MKELISMWKTVPQLLEARPRQRPIDFKCPRMVRFVDSFPKTATGKIQKNKIIGGYLGESSPFWER
jgi:acyl-coenzyme A synthetase/AMP-(fatty) acid ligase